MVVLRNAITEFSLWLYENEHWTKVFRCSVSHRLPRKQTLDELSQAIVNNQDKIKFVFNSSNALLMQKRSEAFQDYPINKQVEVLKKDQLQQSIAGHNDWIYQIFRKDSI